MPGLCGVGGYLRWSESGRYAGEQVPDGSTVQAHGWGHLCIFFSILKYRLGTVGILQSPGGMLP